LDTDCPTRRRSERESAVSLRDKFNVIGGWLPSLTFAFGETMNKWQIICPVVAIAVVAIFALGGQGRREHRYYVLEQTRMIGEELSRGTNSPRLAALGPALQARLSEFLTPQSGVAEVVLGDQSAPLGDGAACSRLVLSNSIGERLGIRLQQDAGPERFHILGYWTITRTTAWSGPEPSRSDHHENRKP
jgi:hypothetical protein